MKLKEIALAVAMLAVAGAVCAGDNSGLQIQGQAATGYRPGGQVGGVLEPVKKLIINQAGNQVTAANPVDGNDKPILVTTTAKVNGCDTGLKLAALSQKWWCAPSTDPDSLVSVPANQYVNCASYIGSYGIPSGSTGMFKTTTENNPKNAAFGQVLATDASSCVVAAPIPVPVPVPAPVPVPVPPAPVPVPVPVPPPVPAPVPCVSAPSPTKTTACLSPQTGNYTYTTETAACTGNVGAVLSSNTSTCVAPGPVAPPAPTCNSIPSALTPTLCPAGSFGIYKVKTETAACTGNLGALLVSTQGTDCTPISPPNPPTPPTPPAITVADWCVVPYFDANTGIGPAATRRTWSDGSVTDAGPEPFGSLVANYYGLPNRGWTYEYGYINNAGYCWNDASYPFQ